MKKQYLSIILLLIALLSCSKKDTLFKEISPKTSNIIFENNLNQTEEFNLIEYLYFYNGGGVAVGDINNDGFNDIYLSANQEENKLYLNKGNFIFEDITAKANLSSPGGWKTGVVMIDINGDGYLDIYQNRLGGYKNINGKNQLYINNRDLTFTEVAQDYGLDFEGFSTHSAFFDYDKDGDLDMYLLNHSIHSELTYGNSKSRFERDLKSGDKFFRHDVVDGKSFFTDVSESSGILGSNIGYGLGVSVSDINKDGCEDIYISNDFRENDYLYINNCDGTFSENLEDYIRHTSRFSMGNDIGDINNDGLSDILVLDMLPSDEFVLKSSAGEDSYEIYKMKLDFGYNKQFTRNTLQLNLGNDNFAEIAQLSGIHATDWSWSTLIEDFDLDGLNDIFITNGILKRPNDMDYINFISNNQISGDLDNKSKLTNLELIDQMPDGISFWDKDEKLIYANKVMRDWQKNVGFDMEVGAKKLELQKNLVSNGVIKTDKTVDELNEHFNSLRTKVGEKPKATDIQFHVGNNIQTTLVTEIEIENGDTVQRFADVSSDRKREAELRRVYDAIDATTVGIALWGKDHKLIFANEWGRAIQNSFGFDLAPGCSRAAMIENQIKKGFFSIPENLSVDQYIEMSSEEMKKQSEGFSREFSMGDKELVSTSKFLEGEIYIQTFTDVTELKNQEKALKRLQDATDQMPTAMALWDHSDKLVYANKILRDLKALSKELHIYLKQNDDVYNPKVRYL